MNYLTQLTFYFVVIACNCWAESQDWPQWRGLSRDGASQGQAWPRSLNEATLVSLWKVDLEPSYSGPIVQDGMIYTTETANKEREVVRAYSLDSGEELWKTDWEGMMNVPFFAKSNGSWIRSTPATDGTRLFVAGMRDVLVCLDAKTGAEQWRVDFVKRFGTKLPSFGFVCSPLLTNNAVIVQAGASLVALKKSDGSVIWRTLEDEGGMNGSAFSSPVLRTVNGVAQILVQTRTELCGVSPDTGAVLWRQEIKAFRGMNILTPTVYQDTIFTATYGGKTLGIGLTKEADAWTPRTKWEIKMEGYMSSPVVVDGHAYLHLKSQRFACVNLSTGEERWQTKEKFGKYWSMVARGNQILALDEEGALRLIEASPEKLKVIDERKLETKDCWAHLAISGDRVIIRALNRLEVFRWPAPKT